MAKVKEIKVTAITFNPICRYYAWGTKTFKTFTYDDGTKEYSIDGKEVSMDEGNKAYIDLKKANEWYQQTDKCKAFIKREWATYCKRGKKNAEDYVLHESDTFKQEVKEYEISYEEIVERLENAIDQYVEYIDDGRQYRQACENNARIRREIEKFNKLIEARK